MILIDAFFTPYLKKSKDSLQVNRLAVVTLLVSRDRYLRVQQERISRQAIFVNMIHL